MNRGNRLPGIPSHPREGQHWAHFLVREEVARGNMGIVYRVLDTQSNREVALKILVVGHRDEEAGERFKREAKSLARLSHKNIVNVHSYGVHEGIAFITMDYVPGTNLKELLDRAALSRARVVDLLAKIAWAIDHAHSRGVLHRDIKPANVLIGPDGKPRVTDFGLAKLTDASISLTHEGDLIGTPVYMSPEQIQGDVRAMGPSSDVWALGVMLYRMLTGGLPFRGKTVDVVSQAVVQCEPEPPREVDPEIAEDLEGICLAALRKDPKLRYRSAGELARDLEAYLSGRPILAGAVTPAVRVRRTLRFLRVHSLVAASVVGALLLVVALIVTHAVLTSRAESSASRDLVVKATSRRGAAATSLREGERALDELDPWAAVTHADDAREQLRWSKALLERAAAEEPLPDNADPTAEEVEGGAQRDPTLQVLAARVRSLQARALAAQDASREGRVAALRRSYEEAVGLSELEALVEAITCRGDSKHAQQTLPSLEAHEAEAPGRVLRMRCTLQALLPNQDPRKEWTPHLRSEDARLRDVAQELEVAWLLDNDRDRAAGRILELVGDKNPRLRALVARLQRRQGDWVSHRSLEPSAEATPRERFASRLELASGFLHQNHLGQVESVLQDLTERRLPPPQRAQVDLLRIAARCVRDGSDPRLDTLLLSRASGLPARLRAALLACRLDPGAEVPELAGPPRRAQRVALSRAGVRVAEALGRVVLRRLDLPAPEVAPHDLSFRLLARRGDALALASLVVLLLDERRHERVKGLLEESSPQVRAHPAVALGTRLVSKNPFKTGAERELLVSRPPPLGLREGRAALAAYWDRIRTGRMVGADNARRRARAALDLAIRSDPFHLAPRLARARLHLLTAGWGGRPDEARRLALTDAAVACAVDPDAPVAWSLFLQALWVVDPVRYRDSKYLGTWSEPTGPSIDAHVVSLLRALNSTDAEVKLKGNKVEKAAGLRLQYELSRAQRAGRLPLGSRPESTPMATLIEQRLEARWDALETALLWGELLLEKPAVLDGLLLRPIPRIERQELEQLDKDLDQMIRKNHARAIAARAARVVRLLRTLHPSASLEDRARALRSGEAHVEAIARARPLPATTALRVALVLWTCQPDRSELPDLTYWGWDGELHRLLERMKAKQAPASSIQRELQALPQLERLKAN